MWKTYQSLIFEWIVHTPEEKPEGPEVLEPELQKVIGQKDKSPQKQELDVDQRAEMKKRNLWSFAADIFNFIYAYFHSERSSGSPMLQSPYLSPAFGCFVLSSAFSTLSLNST